MSAGRQYTIQDSGAFLDLFTLEPTGSGTLDGLTFAAKDLIDIAGHHTGCGNPDWRDHHPPATANAVCIDQLLAEGACCKGKTITDEFAFSLLGENHFYGTPLNPRASDRVPGGSSSGSASSVACKLVDFALGTDTGGSVRVPAANCGIWGMRPSSGVVSVAGVQPLSPSLDTVGIFASEPDVLVRSMSVLLSAPVPPYEPPESIYLIREAFETCDPDVRLVLEAAAKKSLDFLSVPMREISIRQIDEEENYQDLRNWYEIYRVLQRAEAENSLGSWVSTHHPKMGSMIAESFELTRSLDRRLVPKMKNRRESYSARMKSFLKSRTLICIPTIPSPAPLKESIRTREQAAGGYYPRALSLTCIAGVCRLPQVTMPLANLSGLPVGLSLLAPAGEDAYLLSVIRKYARGQEAGGWGME